MSFFLHTVTSIFKAFFLIIKGDMRANDYIQTSQAHWLLSWLMVILGSFIYTLFLPSLFISDITHETIQADTAFSTFRNANMLSLVCVLLIGYLIVALLQKPLEYQGSLLRYIISQNWLFLFNISIFVPLSVFTSDFDENSPIIGVFIFLFMFVLFFAYRCLKLLLGIHGLKAFILLAILIFVEVTLDNAIDQWFGLIGSIDIIKAQS